MIRIAICEDDCFFLEKERNLIDQYFNKIKVTHEIITFLSGKELVEHHADEFDAIFLDVAMEELDGLSVAKKFREKGTDAFIVFLTAYAEYSLEGYKVDAHRFLLKDSATMEADLAECLDSVLDKMQKTNCKVHLPVLGGDLFIDVSKIVYAESKVHKVTIHVHDKEGNLREYYMYDRLDKMKIWDKDDNLIEEREIRVNDIDPTNADSYELYALSVYGEKSGQNKNAVLDYVLSQDIRESEQYEDFGSYDLNTKENWLDIVNKIMKQQFDVGSMEDYMRFKGFLDFLTNK